MYARPWDKKKEQREQREEKMRTPTGTYLDPLREVRERMGEWAEVAFRLGSDTSMPLVLGICNGKRFTSVSASVEAILGWSPDEMTDRDYWTLIHPDDLQRSLDETAAMFKERRGTVWFVNRYRHKGPHRDGSPRWIRMAWHTTAWSSHGEIVAWGIPLADDLPSPVCPVKGCPLQGMGGSGDDAGR